MPIVNTYGHQNYPRTSVGGGSEGVGSGADALGTKTCDAEEGGWRMEVFRRAGPWSLRAGIGGVLGGSRWFSGRWQVASGCFEGAGGCSGDSGLQLLSARWPTEAKNTPAALGLGRRAIADRPAGRAVRSVSWGNLGRRPTREPRSNDAPRQRQSIRLIDGLTVRRCDAMRCAALPSEEEVDALLLSLRSQAYASRSNRTTPPV